MIGSRAPASAPDLRVRVDYRVRVPAGVDLKSLKTDRGDIAVTGVSGRIVAQTVAGSVRLRRVAGVLKVATLNGEIDAELARLQRGDTVVFDTYNGDIRLRLPGASRAHYALRTFNGTIESSVPMPIQSVYGPHVAHETSGVDDPLVRLTSVNGTIRIER